MLLHSRQVAEPALRHLYPWGQLIHIPITRVSSTVLPRYGTNPALLTPGPVLPAAVGGEGQRGQCLPILFHQTLSTFFCYRSPVSIAQQVLEMRSMVNLLGNTPLKKTELCQQLSHANSFLARCGTWCSPALLCVGWLFDLSLHGSYASWHPVRVTVSSYT